MLQRICASEAMSHLWSEPAFQELWNPTSAVATQLDLKEPRSGRPAKPPRRLEMSLKYLSPVVLDPKAALRNQYFEVIDRITSEMWWCFIPLGKEQLVKLEGTLIDAATGRQFTADDLNAASGVHATDLDLSRLSAQFLPLLVQRIARPQRGSGSYARSVSLLLPPLVRTVAFRLRDVINVLCSRNYVASTSHATLMSLAFPSSPNIFYFVERQIFITSKHFEDSAGWHQERRLRISSTKAHLIRTKRDDKGLQKAAQQLLKSSSYKSAAMCYESALYPDVARNNTNTSGTVAVSLATEGCNYTWAPLADSWGSDHFPLLLNPFRGKTARSRECLTVDWRAFRKHCQKDADSGTFLQLVADSAKAATILSTAQVGQPVPDIQHLKLRAARRRAERIALRTSRPEHWTAFRRVDTVCRRHARRRRNQSWQGVCCSINRSLSVPQAWRLLTSLLLAPRAHRQVLSVAVHMGVSAGNLAELLADQFAARPPALQAPPPEAAALSIPSCHHADWVAAQIQALCSEPIRVYELKAALDQTRRRSTPGADRITFQMLRNLADAEKERLLERFNTIWDTGVFPESWVVAVVTPILKSRKPAIALFSYRPVSLTSAACKAMERVAQARLEWIAAQLQYFPEQQSGFRCQRCTAHSTSDVVATLEDAKATVDVAMLVLLDVKSAFDGLPHAFIEACLDRLGLSGCLRRSISAFLTDRTFRVRVGQELSEPRDITTGVPQGSMPFPVQHGSHGPTRISPGGPTIPCSLLHLCRRRGTLDPGAEEVHAIHSVLATTGTRCGDRIPW
ncbi:hypothetical protein HPB49_010617 [Dermacentor silvarum]|uniref:Uncharacterized protein n=1 Tax=Dermacentor silvarum TaxID=543639 RepID=A0ACB8C8T1_DERSI|nr:hypothetical protein HPB49_010617 [Dermacentor silvarum]